MKKLVSLAAVLAAPAAAQQSAPAWPVTAQGRACTAAMVTPDAESGRLSVTYDSARQEVMLTSLSRAQTMTAETGAVDFNMVLLDNGRTKYDDQWAKRHFDYVRQGDQVQFTTRFAGKKNVDQILRDLATSRRIGFLEKWGQPPVMAYYLDGLAPALPQLKACAERAATGS